MGVCGPGTPLKKMYAAYEALESVCLIPFIVSEISALIRADRRGWLD